VLIPTCNSSACLDAVDSAMIYSTSASASFSLEYVVNVTLVLRNKRIVN